MGSRKWAYMCINSTKPPVTVNIVQGYMYRATFIASQKKKLSNQRTSYILFTVSECALMHAQRRPRNTCDSSLC